jgi:WD40 repeat protein
MKYNLTFFMYLLITIFSSYGMENIRQERILQEITVIEKPIKAQYLKKDRAIILGKNGCSIVNPITNQEIIKIDNDTYEYYSFLDLSPDKKEVAISRHDRIKICNADTGEQIWNKKSSYDMNKVTFSPQGKFLFLASNDMNVNASTIREYDYTKNLSTTAYINYSLYPNIALHPTQNILCTGDHKKEMFLYDSHNLDLALLKTEKLDFTAHNYCYSHDGSFIIATGFNDIRIMDTNLNHLFSFSSNHDEKCFHTTKLNANSTLLAALSKTRQLDPSYCIEYYSLLTQKCIYSAKIENEIGAYYFVDLSFSPDENELMITLHKKCIIIPIPINKQTIFAYWILKNYQENNSTIPHDVVQYILSTLLEAA